MRVSTRLRTTVSAPNTPASQPTLAGSSGATSAPPASPVTASTLTPITETDDSDSHTLAQPVTVAHIVAPKPPHHTQIDSDSSSDFEYPCFHTNYAVPSMSFIPNQVAIVEHIHQSKSPTLLAGEIDPAVMRTFELGCLDFFDCKEIKEEDQVRKILGSFRDTRIRNWISGDRNRLLTLSFSDFMSELRANYLDPDWEPTVRRRILAATLKQNQSFWDWFSHMQSLNSLLANTASHFSDTSLREKLEAGLDPELTRRCNANKVDKILLLRPWALEVKRHDENRRADLKRAREVTEEVFNRREDNGKRRRANNNSNNAGRYNNGAENTANYTANPAAATAAAIADTAQCLAALTEAERDQLDNNNGCRKCRRLNVYHISKNCPNGFPDAATYTGLINHPLHPPPPTAPVPTATVNTAPAPVAGPSTRSNSSRNRPQNRPIAAVGSWADDTAATFPSALSALGEGTDTEDKGNDEVSAPF